MVHPRPQLPTGNGEVVCRPSISEWEGVVRANRSAAESWTFRVGGLDACALRTMARSEALVTGARYTEGLGISARSQGLPEAPIVATGHQPEMFHPGVWVKNFLVDSYAGDSGASAFNLVVDTDGFDELGIAVPCVHRGVQQCRHVLSTGEPDACYGTSQPASRDEILGFGAAVGESLATLSAPAIRRHFDRFLDGLVEASVTAANLADLVTGARRRFEASAGTGYLELPLTGLANGQAFARFLCDLALNAERFAASYNDELADYRELTGTRSAAQPVPDLAVGETVELPFWAIVDRHRRPVFVRRESGMIVLEDGEQRLCTAHEDAGSLVRALSECPASFAPKALALTMFIRLFCCDLFVHGIGGGRYDRVTDGVIRRYFDVEPPLYAVASMTLFLPLGAHLVTAEEVAAAKERLNRLEHNPDALLAEVDFDDESERVLAAKLASKKASLVKAIGAVDADKKTLGLRIRAVNAELAQLLAPLRASYEQQYAELTVRHEASTVLSDRTYPFCLWDPAEVADKVR